MATVWGVVVLLLGLLAWGGQAISFIGPDVAARWGLTETEEAVEPAFWADVRGEALWDLLSLWTLPAAGLLLLLDVAAWSAFGLVGGGMYVYFAGRGILTRLELRRRGLRIGEPADVRLGLVLLSVWGVVGAVTVIAAVVSR